MARSLGPRHGRPIGVRVLAILALVGAFTASVPVTAAAVDSSRPIEYLALGDSLAFGYNPLVPLADRTNAANFPAYPDLVAVALRDHLTNASCSGETTSHLISLTGSDHGCGDWRFVYHWALHADYDDASSPISQLAFADGFLQSHPKTRLVTIDIGANDLGRLRDVCGGVENVGCIVAGIPAMLQTMTANLDTIYGHIRNVDGYNHKLVALTFYSPNYADVLTTGAIMQVNQVLVERTEAWGGIVADGFGAFAVASAAYGGDTCAAGLRIALPGGGCDDHPSEAGRELLAQTIVQVLRQD